MKLLIAIFCLSSSFSFAQDSVVQQISTQVLIDPYFQRFDDLASIELKIYYYPFYNDVQLIEIDYYTESLEQGALGDMMHPRGGSDYYDALSANTPNGYLVRDRFGKIISYYNIKNTQNIPMLESVQNAKIQSHKSRLEQDKETMFSRVRSNAQTMWMSEVGYRYKVFNPDESGMLVQKQGLLDTLGNLVLPVEYDHIYLEGKVLKISKNRKWGTIDEYMKPVIDISYARLELLSKNQYLACNEYCTLINKKGDRIHPFKYDDVQFVKGSSNDYLMYTEVGRVGLLDTDFKRITGPNYASIEATEVGYIVTDSTNHYGLLNRDGKQITKMEFTSRKPKYLNSGVYSVTALDEKYMGSNRVALTGWVDTLGNAIGEKKYYQVKGFVNGKAQVMYGYKWGLVNREGKEITPIKYSQIYNEFEGRTIVQIIDKYGVLDSLGNEIIPVEYDQVSCAHSELILVRNDEGLLGFVDDKNTVVIPFLYDNAWCFSDGLAKISKDRRVGLINKKGEELTNYKYDDIYSATKGGRMMKKEGLYGMLDSEGKEVVPPIYRKFKYKDGGVVKFESGNKSFVYRPK